MNHSRDSQSFRKSGGHPLSASPSGDIATDCFGAKPFGAEGCILSDICLGMCSSPMTAIPPLSADSSSVSGARFNGG